MKKFYPRSALIIIGEMIFVTIDVFCLVGMVYAILDYFATYDWYYIIILLSAIIVGVVSSIYLLSFLKKKIILQDKEMIVCADMADKNGIFLRRLQHKVIISYEEIQDVKLSSVTTDSNGHQVKNVFVEMPYIVFVCKSGIQKLVNVYFYSKNQVVNIIDEIANKARSVGNELNLKSGAEILSAFIEKEKNIKF